MSSPLASLERVLRIGVAVLALAVAILANVRAHAAPSLVWKLAHDVPAVTIELKVVTLSELKSVLHKHDPRNQLAAPKTVGFSLLMRNTAGAYRCEIYVLRANDSETIEHETRHCHGWVHP